MTAETRPIRTLLIPINADSNRKIRTPEKLDSAATAARRYAARKQVKLGGWVVFMIRRKLAALADKATYQVLLIGLIMFHVRVWLSRNTSDRPEINTRSECSLR